MTLCLAGVTVKVKVRLLIVACVSWYNSGSVVAAAEHVNQPFLNRFAEADLIAVLEDEFAGSVRELADAAEVFFIDHNRSVDLYKLVARQLLHEIQHGFAGLYVF